MDFDSCLNEFNKYVANYDLKIAENKYKYDHTLRVIEFTKTICKNENFNEEETNIALICSLLHDIARFEEWTKYHSWNEIDHGDLGYEILSNKNYILKFVSDEYKATVLSTVKYHNKLEIPDMIFIKVYFFLSFKAFSIFLYIISSIKGTQTNPVILYSFKLLATCLKPSQNAIVIPE